MKRLTVEELNQEIQKVVRLNKTVMAENGYGFGYVEEGDGGSTINTLAMTELPVLIKELQKENILPDNGAFVHYTTGSGSEHSSQTNQSHKFIIFDKNVNVLGVVPYEDVLIYQGETINAELRYGLKEDGFAKIIEIILLADLQAERDVELAKEQHAQIKKIQERHNCSWEDAFDIWNEDTTHLEDGE